MILTVRRLRQEDCCQFEANLGLKIRKERRRGGGTKGGREGRREGGTRAGAGVNLGGGGGEEERRRGRRLGKRQCCLLQMELGESVFSLGLCIFPPE